MQRLAAYSDMEHWKKIFAIIWSGQLASILSSSIVSYAIIFWMSLETGSAEVLALAAMAGMIPQSLLGPLIGVYVDRWDRKRTMILADSFIALCTLALALLFWAGIARTGHIYLLLICRSVGSAFHMPAMQASIPLLAPEAQLTRIAGINQIISSFSSIAGPALGALLLNLTSIGNILLLDVAGAAIACIALLFVHIPNPERNAPPPGLRPELREGFAAVGAVPGLGRLFAVAIAIYFFIMPVGVMFPLMTLQHFGGGSFEMSLIEIVWGGGALLGGAIMGARGYRINRIVLINAMNAVVGLSFLLSGLLPPSGFRWFVLFTTLEGVAGGIFNAAFIAVIQSRIHSAVLGRVLSLYLSFGMLPSALGLLGVGFLAEHVGLTHTFIACGSIIILIALSAFMQPALLDLDRTRNTLPSATRRASGRTAQEEVSPQNKESGIP